MKAIELTYHRLLAEVISKRGLPYRGSAFASLHWCVFDAPLLDKQLLEYIESGLPKWDGWPNELMDLRDRFVSGRDPLDLRALRQLLLFCYKAEHIHTNETECKAVSEWRSCNAAVKAYGESLSDSSPLLLGRVRRNVSSVLGLVDWREITPFHGPGAVYDGNINKGQWSKWFTTIDFLYPYYEFFGISRLNYRDGAEGFEVDDSIVARLIAVPKDSRGPRLICVHPTESIWIQQGLRIKLERAIARTRPKRPGWYWPRGRINFDDQTVNALLALKASGDRSYATLDLKEASDRLSDRLVQILFGRHYRWFGCCRAQFVEIPRGMTLAGHGLGSVNGSAPLLREEIHSYAPMGNATTFPVQSLVFWSICVSAMEARGFHQPSDCYVFGDDLVVPNAMAQVCIDALETFGLVVNRRKSFFQGSFRESCGIEAYEGVDVTPVRWKTTYDALSLEDLQSLSSLAQRLRRQGYEDAAKELYSILSRRLSAMRLKLSCTNNPDHGGIAEFTENQISVWRDAYWHRDIQWFVSPILRLSQGERALEHGWNHVLSSLTSLEKTGRSCDPACTPSRRTRLNRGWASVL